VDFKKTLRFRLPESTACTAAVVGVVPRRMVLGGADSFYEPDGMAAAVRPQRWLA